MTEYDGESKAANTPVIKLVRAKGRITVLGPVQATRNTVPEKGGFMATAFLAKYKSLSGSPNQAAAKAGGGRHKYGAMTLPLYEEPAFMDYGKESSASSGTALVIGNRKYDNSKKMGSTAIQNRDVDAAWSDADRIANNLKSRSFKVTELKDLKGSEVTKAIRDATSSLQKASCLFLYFTGHGTFDGLIGIDGEATAPSELTALMNQALRVEADLVMVFDSCHQGYIVDVCRLVLLEQLKRLCTADSKLLAFMEPTSKLAIAKNAYNDRIGTISKEQWEAEELLALNASHENQMEWSKILDKKGNVWNEFVATSQPLIDQAITAFSTTKGRLAHLSLKRCNKKHGLDQDDEKKIWAQLDSIDVILNNALTLMTNAQRWQRAPSKGVVVPKF
jgi:hypothetical protein